MNRLLSASDPLVHSVLVALCDDERIQARAVKYLAALEDNAAKIGARQQQQQQPVGGGGGGGGGASGTSSGPAVAVGSSFTTTTTTTTTTSPNPLKRKAAGMMSAASTMPAQLCIMCKGAFSPGDNSPTA